MGPKAKMANKADIVAQPAHLAVVNAACLKVESEFQLCSNGRLISNADR